MIGILLLAGCSQPVARELPASFGPNPFLDPGVEVILQFDYVAGRKPTSFAVDGLLATMQDVGSHAEPQFREISPDHQGDWSPEQILMQHARSYPGNWSSWKLNDSYVLHILYLDGGLYSPGAEAHGAYGVSLFQGGWPLIAVFPDSFNRTNLYAVSTNVPGQRSHGYERAVLVHEYGHVLGLVNCDLPQTEPHDHAESPCHSALQSSVMYPGVHNNDPLTWALDDQMQSIWRFDEQDWADIRAEQARRSAGKV